MNEKILVTGGSGLLGYALRELLPDGSFVSGRDYDLRDICAARRMFAEYQPDIVIHLAAKVGGVKKNARENASLFSDNILINTNVLTIANEFRTKRVLGVLSSCAYQYYDDRPSNEDDLHRGSPFFGNLGYASSKRMLDVQTRLLETQYGAEFTTITPVTMYGPNDNWDLEDGHVIGSLIHKCYLAKTQKRPLEIWGSGRARRQFVFSFDVAKLILEILKGTYQGPETLIVAPNDGYTIKEIAYLVAEAMGFKGEIKFDISKPEGALVKVLNGGKFRERFPSFSFTDINKGLQLAAQWFLNYIVPNDVEEAQSATL